MKLKSHHLSLLSRIVRGMVVLALCVSIGLHWAVLQSAAWVGMAVAYSVEKGSVVEGLSDTFDGAHPCPLCKAVEKGVESEQQPKDGQPSPSKTKELKLTLALVSIPHFVFPPVVPEVWITTSSAALSRHERPVTPPPQLG
jgi:hypothetical protein